MTGRGGLRVRASRIARDADGGFTLAEVVVSMTVMTVFLAMFTTSIVQMFQSANRNEAISTSRSQLSIAFQRLDREIRYAASISTEGAVGADQYVEFLTSNTGTPICTQLRLHVANAQVQLRTWRQGSSPLVPGAWVPLASDVSATKPFTFLAASGPLTFQRLRLQLIASSGSGSRTVTRETDVTFTALNTSINTSDPLICTEGRPIP